MYISEIADEFDKCSVDDNETNYECIALFINDFVSFYRKISQESADILETLTRSGSDFRICIYIVSSLGDLAFINAFRATIKAFDNCIKKGNAIAAGGNIKNYMA